ncbi:hypothetical protein CPB84DRAFT_1965745 [Gymnopilus junonius]|uniref:F-box domain-containing protein n=1 Tax=Gymnopilus junonius TaxID=109634 RepID=A0A9P5NDY2_GYMJU|nr:hypothetical protein CPB84DRAFT_1965745 [Gymnopilus junonius]
MQHLELKIAQAQDVFIFSHLIEQHRQLRTEMNKMHNPVILQVPPEVASIIFKFYLPEMPVSADSRKEQPRNTTMAPLLLGAVCRGWRDIAWSIPQLWTYIDVVLDSGKESEFSLISEWLNRSGGLPLSIHVYTRGLRRTIPRWEIVDLINKYSARWEVLELFVPAPLVNMFRGNLENQYFILRDLRIHSGFRLPEQKGDIPIRALRPEPTNVYIDGILHLSSIWISWNRVTFVDVETILASECVRLFQHAVMLERCNLRDIWDLEEQSLDFVITHPHLQDLKLKPRYPEAIKQLLGALTLPALQKLEIDMDSKYLPIIELHLLAQHSSFQLKELLVISSDFSDGDMYNLLSDTPYLERLKICPAADADFCITEFLAKISDTNILNKSRHGEPGFLAHLRTLEIQAPWEID